MTSEASVVNYAGHVVKQSPTASPPLRRRGSAGEDESAALEAFPVGPGIPGGAVRPPPSHDAFGSTLTCRVTCKISASAVQLHTRWMPLSDRQRLYSESEQISLLTT